MNFLIEHLRYGVENLSNCCSYRNIFNVSLGFVWQFITLAGFHANALQVSEFAKAYGGERGMEAYVNMIQRKERDAGVETLTHQKWSGAELLDRMLGVATMGQG